MTFRYVQKIVKDEVDMRQTHQIPCKILGYFPEHDGGPVAVCIPYARIGSSDQDENRTRTDFFEEYAKEIYVRFPEGVRFHVNTDLYDMWVLSDWHYAREGFPVLKQEFRGKLNNVSAGWTRDDIAKQKNPLDKSPKQKALEEQRLLQAKTCETKEPMYPSGQDVWMGSLRQKVDNLVTEIWDKPRRMSARINRNFSTFLTEKVDFPLADGVRVQWRDRIEHPFQKYVGSTAVTPYNRFILSILDPGLVLGLANGLIAFFRQQDQKVSAKFTFVEEFEFIDNNQFLPES